MKRSKRHKKYNWICPLCKTNLRINKEFIYDGDHLFLKHGIVVSIVDIKPYGQTTGSEIVLRAAMRSAFR